MSALQMMQARKALLNVREGSRVKHTDGRLARAMHSLYRDSHEIIVQTTMTPGRMKSPDVMETWQVEEMTAAPGKKTTHMTRRKGRARRHKN